MVTTAELAQTIQERFPNLAFLANHPEIGPILREATDPNKGFSAETFQWKVSQTGWWKSHNDAQRAWMTMSNINPGQAKRMRTGTAAELDAMAKRMGVSLTSAQLKWITESVLANGQSLESAEVKRGIMSMWNGQDYSKGEVGVNAQQIMALAKSQYLRPMSSNEGHELARRIVRGDDTLEAVQMRLTREAAERFPHLKERISQGLTPAQIVEPYRQIVAEELEYGDISEVDVQKSPTWRQLMGIRQSDGKMRMMTESEVMKLARSQPRYWKTSKGREADHTMASTLMSVFGARKSLGG